MPTSEPPPATPSAQPSGDTTGSGLILDWATLGDPGFGEAIWFTDTAVANGRFVAVGSADDSGGIWTSSDGLTWAPAVLPEEFPDGGSLSSVVAGGPGFVAVGYWGPNGIVATSVDGQTWERVDDAISAAWQTHIAAVTGRLVAFSVGPLLGPVGSVSTSGDGKTWQRSDDPAALDVVDGLLALTGDGSTLWAFSRDGDEPRLSRQLIEVWRSDDGLAWTQVGRIEGSRDATWASAASGEKGMVLIAGPIRTGDDRYTWKTWYSADGTTWGANDSLSRGPLVIDDVLADRVGFVAVGHYDPCPFTETDDVGVTWTSVDGLIWRMMETEGWNGREIQALARNDRTLIGLGIDWNRVDDEEDGGLVWTTVLPDSAVEGPRFTTVEPDLPPGCE